MNLGHFWMKHYSDFYLVNFGPQHPAAHGVLRRLLKLDGEYIKRLDPEIGLLHRGTEKLIESKTSEQSLPYLDRLDYVTRRVQENLFANSVENVMLTGVPLVTRYYRKLLLERTRVLNHIRALTTHALDVGALTPFLWGFEQREHLRSLYERLCGSRRHASFIRPGGLARKVPDSFLRNVRQVTALVLNFLEELEELLDHNPIWRMRLSEVGYIRTKSAVKKFGITGPLAHSVGAVNSNKLTVDGGADPCRDDNLQFISFKGDCLDRYLRRIDER